MTLIDRIALCQSILLYLEAKNSVNVKLPFLFICNYFLFYVHKYTKRTKESGVNRGAFKHKHENIQSLRDCTKASEEL